VRPAVANDGGDITFRGFKDGVVYLDMKGALLRLPIVDRDTAARHPEPAASLPARRGRSQANGIAATDVGARTGHESELANSEQRMANKGDYYSLFAIRYSLCSARSHLSSTL
jgi:hypothetical protein